MQENSNTIFHKVTKEVFYILSHTSPDFKVEFSYFEATNNLENTLILKSHHNLETKAHRNFLRYQSDFYAFFKRYHKAGILSDIIQQADSQWQVEFLRSAENARIIALAYDRNKQMLGLKNNLKGYAKTLKDDDLYYFLNILNFSLPASLFQDRNKISYDYDFQELHRYICSQKEFLALVLSTIHINSRVLHDNNSSESSNNIFEDVSNDDLDIDINQGNSHNQDNSDNSDNSHSQETINRQDNTVHQKPNKGNDTENNQENQYDTQSIHGRKLHTTYEVQDYFAYTTKYDKEVISIDLESFQGEAVNLRQKLDMELNNISNSNINLLSLKLQRKLQAKKYNSRRENLSYGTLNTRKLYKAIISPMDPHVYYQETKQAEIDTTVTILVDNSGSQMGKAITTSCMSCDLLAKVFTRCNIPCEILGFTTRQWQGGESFTDWQQYIKANPHKLQESNNAGRLNDLLHIIYKSANMQYNVSKNHIAMMLKRGILKENIDGEALEWAYQRILKRPEQRKIILVISDGVPADDITQTYNHKNYLLKHLTEVIESINKDNKIELLAIGMGFDIKSIYKNSIPITDHTNLAQTIMHLFLNKLI